MQYFNPKPDFKIISKNYSLPEELDIIEQSYQDGFPVYLDNVYTDENVAEIEEGFKVILRKYDLDVHYDNLLFLVLTKVAEHEAVLEELYFQYGQRRRTKELASLLLALANNTVKQYDALVLKTLKNTAKVTDKSVIHWIGTTLTDVIRQGKMPLVDYEYRIMKDFFDEAENGSTLSITKLTLEAERKVIFPTKNIRNSYADICIYLYPYLTDQTAIKPNAETLFSDAMLNFYFDTLNLFGYLKPDEIESEGKDYIGTLLKNRIKKLNPDYQGNKSK